MPELQRITAPFTADQVDALNRWQRYGRVHPFTCGSGNRTDAAHQDGEGKLVATLSGWHCPYCTYTQNWAHAFMVEAMQHAQFEVEGVDRDAVTIRDLNLGSKSVTNDAEYVVDQLRGLGLLTAGCKLFYHDSAGDLDEIVWDQGEISFRPGPRRAAVRDR